MLCITADSPGFETEKDPVGFERIENFFPLFLVGKTPVSMTFPGFQRADSSICQSGKGEDAETREEQSRKNNAASGQVLVPLKGCTQQYL